MVAELVNQLHEVIDGTKKRLILCYPQLNTYYAKTIMAAEIDARVFTEERLS